MKIYLVGGAVRDKLLGLPVHERDWVVVGATPQQMLDLGYKQVGKDFPVFLHPETGEEYALARTERKTAPGYKGFSFHASPDVTLEEDLKRRDLTINAMAESPEGELIDPYGGQEDLRLGKLRHVSPAFAEDPVRILRVARFAARFAKMGFSVTHGTNTLMRNMVEKGEVDHLVPERVWAELNKALATDAPEKFFTVLHGCGVLAILFPEIESTYADDPGTHTGSDKLPRALSALRHSAEQTDDTRVRFAALLLSLHTDKTVEQRIADAEAICKRYRVPGEYQALAVSAIRHETDIASNDPCVLLGIMESTRALHDASRWHRLLDTYVLSERITRERAQQLDDARQKAVAINANFLDEPSLSGPAIGAAINKKRCQAISDALPK
ncbi:tRNA nucleotidyltransferase (CCA-adding enzyme) [Thiogranum longum]|uniref:CCA-adding enzyme n=1 Tax=Thiogranum longum TaxID=1537524 RepID=A0A4R1HC12_9GAMM|nr:multifunctional CCA tRNA nucleotidyl transferase/2'3'-cyclic phosphodiesterase/2'nucleotidase/phosphatase [Thiogranum longum]TCK19537.1 tRNA nucleotidyltransferase (CCA-adding enzyme) [Thiogranum longum]